jgi:hypothetical protein
LSKQVVEDQRAIGDRISGDLTNSAKSSGGCRGRSGNDGATALWKQFGIAVWVPGRRRQRIPSRMTVFSDQLPAIRWE